MNLPEKLLILLVMAPLLAMGQGRSDQDFPMIRYVEGKGAWPWTIEDGARVGGVIPDVVTRVFREAGVRVSPYLTVASRLLLEAENGYADAVTVVFFEALGPEDYPPSLKVCPEPLWSIDVFVIWHKDTDLQSLSTEDLSGLKVGMWTMPPSLIEKADLDYDFVSGGNRVLFLDTIPMFKSLLAGRVDAVLSDWEGARAVAKKLNASGQLQKGRSVGRLDVHLAMTKRWLNDHPHISSVCSYIEPLKQAGEFERIGERYF